MTSNLFKHFIHILSSSRKYFGGTSIEKQKLKHASGIKFFWSSPEYSMFPDKHCRRKTCKIQSFFWSVFCFCFSWFCDVYKNLQQLCAGNLIQLRLVFHAMKIFCVWECKNFPLEPVFWSNNYKYRGNWNYFPVHYFSTPHRVFSKSLPDKLKPTET